MFKYILIIFGFILAINLANSNENVEVVYQWKVVEFENLPLPENATIGRHRYYDPEHINIMQMGYHPLSGLMIVTVTRTRSGVPITMGAFCVDDYPPGSSPKIWAFPSNEANLLRASDYDRPSLGIPNIPTPNIINQIQSSPLNIFKKTTTTPSPNEIDKTPRLMSTYTVNIDEKCNRAYTIDTGILTFSLLESYKVQKPSILVYDLPEDACKNNRNFSLIRRAEFPDDIGSNIPAGILYMTLDHQSDNCDDLFIYITNVYAHYLAVYDYKNDDFWVFRNYPSFQPELAESFIFDEGFSFQLGLGIVSLALDYPDENGDRMAYYTPSTSTSLYAVSTKVLKNKEKAQGRNARDDFKFIGNKGRKSQTSKMAVDYKHGVVFFLEFQSNRVRCWNMKKPFTQENIGVVYQSPTPMYGMMLFIDSKGYIWFNKSHTGLMVGASLRLKLDKEHSIFYRVKVDDAINGTVCENSQQSVEQ